MEFIESMTNSVLVQAVKYESVVSTQRQSDDILECTTTLATQLSRSETTVDPMRFKQERHRFSQDDVAQLMKWNKIR